MKLEVHILSHDFEAFLPFALRHWLTLGASITVHDGGPCGVSTDTALAYGAKVVPWDTAKQLNDELARKKKNECWKGTAADWVVCVDADELLHFPHGMEQTLATYERMGAAIIKPQGFEMFSEVWFDPIEHHGAQITDLVKDGAPDDKWYSKCFFSPKRVAEINFGYGAHECEPVLKDGRRLVVDQKWPKADPECQLLHYHQLGSVERLAARYDATRARFSAFNLRARLGNLTDGSLHVQQKRALILPSLRRVLE